MVGRVQRGRVEQPRRPLTRHLIRRAGQVLRQRDRLAGLRVRLQRDRHRQRVDVLGAVLHRRLRLDRHHVGDDVHITAAVPVRVQQPIGLRRAGHHLGVHHLDTLAVPGQIISQQIPAVDHAGVLHHQLVGDGPGAVVVRVLRRAGHHPLVELVVDVRVAEVDGVVVLPRPAGRDRRVGEVALVGRLHDAVGVVAVGVHGVRVTGVGHRRVPVLQRTTRPVIGRIVHTHHIIRVRLQLIRRIIRREVILTLPVGRRGADQGAVTVRVHLIQIHRGTLHHRLIRILHTVVIDVIPDKVANLDRRRRRQHGRRPEAVALTVDARLGAHQSALDHGPARVIRLAGVLKESTHPGLQAGVRDMQAGRQHTVVPARDDDDRTQRLIRVHRAGTADVAPVGVEVLQPAWAEDALRHAGTDDSASYTVALKCESAVTARRGDEHVTF